MINWLLDVHHAFKQSDSTFFLSVSLLDRTFKATKEALPLEPDLHLTGITSLWVASKVEEVRALKLATVSRQIGHGKFTEAEIKQNEN